MIPADLLDAWAEDILTRRLYGPRVAVGDIIRAPEGTGHDTGCRCGDPDCKYCKVQYEPPRISGWVSKNGRRLSLDSLENILTVLEWLEEALWHTRAPKLKPEVWWFP